MYTLKSSTWIDRLWFVTVIVLLFVHYVQPQGHILALRVLQPYMILTMLLVGFLFITRSNLIQWQYPQMRYIWGTFLIILLITPYADNPRASLGTSRMMLLYVPLLLSVLALITTTCRLKGIMNTMVIIASITSVITIASVSADGGTTGNKNFLENANEFALFASMMVPYCYFMVWYERQLITKLIFFTALSLTTLAIVLSFSRAGLVSVAASGVVIWWYSPNKKITAIIGALLITAALWVGGQSYRDEMSTITDTSYSTTQGRLEMWKVSWNKFIENPFGNGLQSSRITFNMRQQMENHSIWLTSAVETGIFGFLLFVMLWASSLRDALILSRCRGKTEDHQYIRYFGRGMLGALVAYGVAGTFTHAFYYPHFWYFCIFTAVATKTLYFLNYEKGQIHESATFH